MSADIRVLSSDHRPGHFPTMDFSTWIDDRVSHDQHYMVKEPHSGPWLVELVSGSFPVYFHNRDKLAVELAQDEKVVCPGLYLTSLLLKFTQAYFELLSGATLEMEPCLLSSI